MNTKILDFLKGYFHKQGDCCPIIEIDKFIVCNFIGKVRRKAQIFVNKLIENKYIKMSEDGQYLEYIGYVEE